MDDFNDELIASIIHAEGATYGVVAVPNSETLAVFSHDDRGWRGVGSAHHVDGTAALVGKPRDEVVAALDVALTATRGSDPATKETP